MTYREAWETIYFKHCQETCDYAYMDNCQEEKCEYYMALQALNRQYYAECGSVWVKPKADRKTEPQKICKYCNGRCSWWVDGDCMNDNDCRFKPKDEPQTERSE